MWQQVVKMEKEAAKKAAEKGIKKFAVSAGAIPPSKFPINKNNVDLMKKVTKNLDLSSNGVLAEGLGKNLNKIV
jgi:hypothetical protein